MKSLFPGMAAALLAMASCWVSPDPAGDAGVVADAVVMDDGSGGDGTGDSADAADVAVGDIPDGACPATVERVGEMDDPVHGYDLVLSLNGQRALRVRVAACGTPLPGQAVMFSEIEDEDDACALDLDVASTGDDGVATVNVSNVYPGECHGGSECRLRACLDDGACLDVRVQLGDKCMKPLVIGFAEYTGVHPLVALADVLLFKNAANGRPACEDLRVDKLPTADLASGKVSLLTTTSYTEHELKDLETEKEQTYTVLCRAYEEGSTLVRAYGCVDGVDVEYGGYVFVECPLNDIPAKVVGTYDLTSTLDLATGLPPGVETVVNYVIDFVAAPTATLMKMMCDPAIAASGSALADLCDAVFQDPVDPRIDALTATGEIVKTIIDAQVSGMLEAACPEEDPLLCQNMNWYQPTIADVLRKFSLLSRLTCGTEPDADGAIPPGGCHEAWDSVVLTWTYGLSCQPTNPTCGTVTTPLATVQGGASPVTDDVEVRMLEGGTKMAIARHPVGLRLGSLIDYVFEKVVFPSLFGGGNDGLPPVDSLEALIGSLLAGRNCLTGMTCCADFADNVVSQAGGLSANLVQGACDALISSGAAHVRKFLLDLDAPVDGFRLATPDGHPCAVHDTNQDGKLDALGKNVAGGQCDWDVSVTAGSYDFTMNGRFYGVRQ